MNRLTINSFNCSAQAMGGVNQTTATLTTYFTHQCGINCYLGFFEDMSSEFEPLPEFKGRILLKRQFDEQAFFGGHYTAGYYDYHQGLGDWCDQIDSLLQLLQQRLEAGLQMGVVHRVKADTFFPLYDQQNCRRNYEAIVDTTNH